MAKTAIALLISAVALQAQYLTHRDPTAPRTKDGKVNLSAPVPRANGKPDLSGIWQWERTPLSEFEKVMGPNPQLVQVDLSEVTKHALNVFWDYQPGTEPMRPQAGKIMEERMKTGQQFQSLHCLPESLPNALMVEQFKIIQAPAESVFMFGNISPARQVYTDGRALPKDPNPSWMGYSVGKWEGDTLVIQTVGITDRAWLDNFGHPRSEAMKLTERYRRRDFGHMDVEVTIDDPTFYTRPFSLKSTLYLMPDTDILEYVCQENEKDQAHQPR